jgi:hypothetical protein
VCFAADVEAFGRNGGIGFSMACEFDFSDKSIEQLRQAVTDRGSGAVFVFLTHEGIAQCDKPLSVPGIQRNTAFVVVVVRAFANR